MSKDWRGALDLLISDDQMSYEHAISLLKGETELVGNSSSGIFLKPIEDKSSVELYLDTLAFQNAGLWRNGDYVYRPVKRIVALGPKDRNPLVKYIDLLDWDSHNLLKARFDSYATGNEVVTFPEGLVEQESIDLTGNKEPEDMAVIWEQISDYPLWIVPARDPITALTRGIKHRTLETVGDTSLIELMADKDRYKTYLYENKHKLNEKQEDDYWQFRDADRLTELSSMRKRIEEQAGPKGGDGWIRMPIHKKDSDQIQSYLDVPKAPFYRWALRNIPSVKLGIHDDWQLVSQVGAKMPHDDPYHTDWVIGAGLDPETFYSKHEDISNSSYTLRMELTTSLTKFEFVTLAKPSNPQRSKVSGKIRRLKPGEVLNKGEIGVIPEASVEYEAALRSAFAVGSALICMTGGKLAHIAVVGREMDVPVIMWDKAHLLDEFHKVSIDMNTGTIKFDVI
ncbi:PEP-utilizing enzyme [Pseudomonas luteola]